MRLTGSAGSRSGYACVRNTVQKTGEDLGLAFEMTRSAFEEGNEYCEEVG